MWWVDEDSPLRTWRDQLDELPCWDINEILVLTIEDIWDGPLTGTLAYHKKIFDYFALFDEDGPSLDINVGRCYLIFMRSNESQKAKEADLGEYDQGTVYRDFIDTQEPIAWFGGSLGDFLTHPERFKDGKMGSKISYR